MTLRLKIFIITFYCFVPLFSQEESMCSSEELLGFEQILDQTFENERNTHSLVDQAIDVSKTLFYLPSCKEKSYQILDKTLHLCTFNKDSVGLAKVFQRKGLHYLLDENYLDAIINYNNALNFQSNKQDSTFYMMLHLYKGYAFNELNDSLSARKEFRKILTYRPDKKSRIYKSAYINIGTTFKNPDSLIYYSQKITDNCRDVDSTQLECYVAYNNIANAYLSKNSPSSALQILNTYIDINKSKTISSETEIYLAIAHSYGLAYYQLGKYKKALVFFEKALNTEFSQKKLTYILKVKKDMSLAHEKLGNFKMAFTISKEIDSLELQFKESKLKKEIANLEAKRTLKNAEANNVDLKLSNSRFERQIVNVKKWTFILSLIVLIGLIYFLISKYRSRLALYKIIEELTMTKLQSLRNVMNPHFLFNSFSALQNLILKEDHLRANEFMTSLSELIRAVLDNSSSIYIALDKELELLNSYLEIEKMRFDKKFNVNLDVPSELKELNPSIPSMIIQPFIENTIIHGFSNLNKKGELFIQFQNHKEILTCTITDNGIGREKASKNKGNNHLSIATTNVQKRLEILNKINRSSANIQIFDLKNKDGSPKGTRVKIDLPIEQKG